LPAWAKCTQRTANAPSDEVFILDVYVTRNLLTVSVLGYIERCKNCRQLVLRRCYSGGLVWRNERWMSEGKETVVVSGGDGGGDCGDVVRLQDVDDLRTGGTNTRLEEPTTITTT
jgi:hypothetical protein